MSISSRMPCVWNSTRGLIQKADDVEVDVDELEEFLIADARRLESKLFVGKC
jgi:hypothetical protein